MVPESPATAKRTGLSMHKPAVAVGATGGGLAKPTPIARSTSASALPPSTTMHHGLAAGSTSVTGYSTTGSTGGTDTGYSSPYFASSTATSPFLTAVDHQHHHHHTNSSGPAQLRSTTHSPALFSKFYDVEHRLPWLSLSGAVGSPALGASAGGGNTEGPKSMFGRRRSDVGLPSSSGRSTPSALDLASSSLLASQSHQDGSSSQQEAAFPQPPQPQPQAHAHHHHHAQHLLGPQELAALSRHNSPMPLNEALPHYLRKKSADSMHSMERSFSSPGTNSLHPPPHTGSHFMLPLGSTTTNAGSHAGGSVGQAAAAAAASPSHLLFAFPGSTSHPTTTVATSVSSSNRPEMERASSTGVLPMMNRPNPRPQAQHKQAQSHLGTTTATNSGPGSTSANGGITAPSTLATGAGSAASFFRTLTPGVHHHHHTSVGLGAITGLDTTSSASHSHSGTSSPSKLFGHHANSSDRDLSSNKEVHA